MRFKKHVFICCNEREDKTRKSCGQECGLNLVKMFKKSIRDKGMDGIIRAQKSGCLDACNYGPSVVVYPDGIYYKGVKPEDVEEIVQSHLINEIPVERLVNTFKGEE